MTEYTTLGRCGIEVSRICFGSLTVSRLGADLPLSEGAAVIAHALHSGINFIDTAQYYDNYEYIKEGIRLYREQGGTVRPIICSKTYAYNRELAREAIDEALARLGTDSIDIFMLHEQESADTLRGHAEALEYLRECRDAGVIRALGISTHTTAAVRGARDFRLSDGTMLDVVFAMFNRDGVGIRGSNEDADTHGSARETRRMARDEMEHELRLCRKAEMGTMLMKVYGGGHLLGSDTSDGARNIGDRDGEEPTPSRRAELALRFALDSGCGDVLAIGMQSCDEVDENLRFLRTGEFSPEFRRAADRRTRRLIVEDYCEGCGRCVRRCGQGAMSLREGVAFCDTSRCVLCGYCAGVCPQFAIKVV